jgi:hypothetical protein
VSAEVFTEGDEAVDPWAKYEELKAELPQSLTEAEYERACKQIADELGI